MECFKLPDLGEGLQDAEIIEWQVTPGDSVNVDDVMVVVETAKAIVELPSPFKGKVGELCAEPGDTVDVGQILVKYSEIAENSESLSSEVVRESVNQEQTNESVSVVGVLTNSDAKAATREEFVVATQSSSIKSSLNDATVNRSRKATALPPALMAFASQLDVEEELRNLIDEHQFSEVISYGDIAKLYEHKKGQTINDSASNIEDHSPFIPLRGTKKLMAQAMIKSHQHVPAVTLFEDAHIGHWRKDEDITVRVIKAIIEACSAVPLLNAWFDDETLSIQTFKDVNIGIAVNSEEGLFVPVLREAQNINPKSMRSIIDKMVKDVKRRSVKPQKLMGATITLSNFGTLTGRYATPIIVPPQVAILGVGALRDEPVVKQGKVGIEKVMPLSLSFDHRAATGAEAAKFLTTIISVLQRAEGA